MDAPEFPRCPACGGSPFDVELLSGWGGQTLPIADCSFYCLSCEHEWKDAALAAALLAADEQILNVPDSEEPTDG